MSIIMLKCSPFLRTALKYVFTILIYKKGDKNVPSNFGPITSQPISAKVYSSEYATESSNYYYKVTASNQKYKNGFWNKISGIIEHIEILTYIIKRYKEKTMSGNNSLRRAECNQWSWSLLTIKSTYYHYVQVELKSLIKDYYHNYALSIDADNYSTEPILIRKGVLQGDCLSPLLFNMVIQAIIKILDDKKAKCMGYNHYEIMSPRYWFQFANDSVFVTSKEEDSQLLLNVFTKWCTWASLIIKVSKCKTSGIKNMAANQYSLNCVYDQTMIWYLL